ncbi:MAG: hypothetical protein AABW99_03100 [archaeon]
MRFKYPKLALLALAFLPSYMIVTAGFFLPVREVILGLGYTGILLGGAFFVYGFTAAPATAALLILSKSQDLVFAALLGGIGSLIGDLIIFKFVRASFMDEITELKEENVVKALSRSIPKGARKYVLPIVAGFIIASPLPDEIGVSLLASSESVTIKNFAIISYVLNTLGIFLILVLGQTILA